MYDRQTYRQDTAEFALVIRIQASAYTQIKHHECMYTYVCMFVCMLVHVGM